MKTQTNWTTSTLPHGHHRVPISPHKKEKEKEKPNSLKVVRAAPKAESNTDAKSGVQKFRVKLLPESGGQECHGCSLYGMLFLQPFTYVLFCYCCVY